MNKKKALQEQPSQQATSPQINKGEQQQRRRHHKEEHRHYSESCAGATPTMLALSRRSRRHFTQWNAIQASSLCFLVFLPLKLGQFEINRNLRPI